MNNDLEILNQALNKLKSGFDSFPDSLNENNADKVSNTLLKVAERMHNNYPYFQPNYAGQMLKPPHAVARLAYMLALYINPNNHALDGSRASSPMEKECVKQIAAMFGWETYIGHLTSGGTMANLEALWVSGMHDKNKLVVSSELSHYTHERISNVLGLSYQKIDADKRGRMDLLALERLLKQGDIGTVVVTLGTTGVGSVDPLVDIVALKEKYNFRIHVDAAYGGYFKLATNLSAYTKKQYAAIDQADSIVIDPHKHGLQPYGCGCILFKNPDDGRFYKHNSPYTYFTSDEMHLGEISLECSRAGAAAVALWATLDLYPLDLGGVFSKSFDICHVTAMRLYDHIKEESEAIILLEPELDIVVWGLRAPSLSEMSARAQKLFHRAADENLHLALLQYPARLLPAHWGDILQDQEVVTCLRTCLMKPEHFDVIDELWVNIRNLIHE